MTGSPVNTKKPSLPSYLLTIFVGVYRLYIFQIHKRSIKYKPAHSEFKLGSSNHDDNRNTASNKMFIKSMVKAKVQIKRKNTSQAILLIQIIFHNRNIWYNVLQNYKLGKNKWNILTWYIL